MKLVVNNTLYYNIHETSWNECTYFEIESLSSDHQCKIYWNPFKEETECQSKIKNSKIKSFNWKNSNVIPNQLVTSQGPEVSCKIIHDGGDILKDYGSSLYCQRAGSVNFDNEKRQDVILNEYYVGDVIHNTGSSQESVNFKYSNGCLIPLTCTFLQYQN